jgi:hypothetical protein
MASNSNSCLDVQNLEFNIFVEFGQYKRVYKFEKLFVYI